MDTTTDRTMEFDELVDNSTKPISALSKSIAFGATNTWAANDVRWLERHWTSLEEVLNPTCKVRHIFMSTVLLIYVMT